jgi:hypothetical protein
MIRGIIKAVPLNPEELCTLKSAEKELVAAQANCALKSKQLDETQGNLLRKLQGNEPTALRVGKYEQRLFMKVVDGVAIFYRKIYRC